MRAAGGCIGNSRAAESSCLAELVHCLLPARSPSERGWGPDLPARSLRIRLPKALLTMRRTPCLLSMEIFEAPAYWLIGSLIVRCSPPPPPAYPRPPCCLPIMQASHIRRLNSLNSRLTKSSSYSMLASIETELRENESHVSFNPNSTFRAW